MRASTVRTHDWWCDTRKGNKGRDAHSLGGSTAYVFRSPKSKTAGAALDDVVLEDEELFSCSSRLPGMILSQAWWFGMSLLTDPLLPLLLVLDFKFGVGHIR